MDSVAVKSFVKSVIEEAIHNAEIKGDFVNEDSETELDLPAEDSDDPEEEPDLHVNTDTDEPEREEIPYPSENENSSEPPEDTPEEEIPVKPTNSTLYGYLSYVPVFGSYFI